MCPQLPARIQGLRQVCVWGGRGGEGQQPYCLPGVEAGRIGVQGRAGQGRAGQRNLALHPGLHQAVRDQTMHQAVWDQTMHQAVRDQTMHQAVRDQTMHQAVRDQTMHQAVRDQTMHGLRWKDWTRHIRLG